MGTSSLILKFYLETLKDDQEEMSYEDLKAKVPGLLKANRKAKGGDYITPLSFYLDVLAQNQDTTAYVFLTPEQKRQLLHKLRITYLLLLTQRQYEINYRKFEHIKSYDKNIAECEKQIDALNNRPTFDNNLPTQLRELDGRPVKYLGLHLGSVLSRNMTEMMDSKTKSFLKGVNLFNQKRLYWVWGSSLINTILSSLPPDFFNTSKASSTMSKVSPVTGIISWSLYYFRFAVHLGLFLKHTLRGPWMSKEEKKVPWTERFKTQWQQRKFDLLNDSLWATCNLACFFWLTSRAGLGPWGDLLTVGLLGMDLCLAAWGFSEQQTQYNKDMLRFSEDIKKLKDKIEEVQALLIVDKEKYEKELKNYQLQLNTLERAQKKCKKDWDFKKASLINNLCYSVGLLISFVLMVAPFFPIAGQALQAVIFTGGAMCFVLNVIYNCVNNTMEKTRAEATVKELRDDLALKIEEFKELVKKNPNLDDNEKKLHFLDIQMLLAQNEHQKKLARYKTMRFVRSLIIEALFPALVFVALVFLPFGIGLGIIGIAVVLAIASNWLVEAVYKPKKQPPVVFDKREYNEFCKDPSHWKYRPNPIKTFFTPVPEFGSKPDGLGPNPIATFFTRVPESNPKPVGLGSDLDRKGPPLPKTK